MTMNAARNSSIAWVADREDVRSALGDHIPLNPSSKESFETTNCVVIYHYFPLLMAAYLHTLNHYELRSF